MTYIVAFHPDATLKHHPDAGPTRLPHVVRLITEADAMEGYALRFGDEEAGS